MFCLKHTDYHTERQGTREHQGLHATKHRKRRGLKNSGGRLVLVNPGIGLQVQDADGVVVCNSAVGRPVLAVHDQAIDTGSVFAVATIDDKVVARDGTDTVGKGGGGVLELCPGSGGDVKDVHVALHCIGSAVGGLLQTTSENDLGAIES